jgi:regulator of protease activity HflC (stomatin/prohibitin superfamily)
MKMAKWGVVLAVLMLSACSKVPAGNVGVKVYLLGGSKGVDTEELGPGRYWIGMNEELYLFPTFTQNYVWTREPVDENGDGNLSDSDGIDESISFQTVEGLSVNADIGISYRIDPSKVPLIYQKYRKGIDEITDLYLRNMVRDALVTVSSTKKIETVYGAGKADLIASVEAAVRKQVEPLGIVVERIYWVGNLRLPDNVTASINAKIQATQMAEQRRNEVEQAKAEAEKARQTAQGEADAKLLIARAEAESIRIRGEALRDNPALVELNAVDKWDGKLPVTMMGGDTVPFIRVPKN